MTLRGWLAVEGALLAISLGPVHYAFGALLLRERLGCVPRPSAGPCRPDDDSALCMILAIVGPEASTGYFLTILGVSFALWGSVAWTTIGGLFVLQHLVAPPRD